MSTQTLASKLQSRISVRAAAIRNAEQWAIVHRTQSQMRDWKDTKAVIKHLTADQCLDKKLLKMTMEVPKMQEEVVYLYGVAVALTESIMGKEFQLEDK